MNVSGKLSRTGRFTPGERAAGTHCTGGCVDLRAGLGAIVIVLIFITIRYIYFHVSHI
jgi:hypothetical protein